jgi:uncharacterized RDD family membrane protein YckC
VQVLALPSPLWRRLAAAVYDGLLLIAVIMVAALAEVLARNLLGYARDWSLLRAWLFLCGLGFFGWFWTHGGQTPGMRAWRLRVRRLDGAGLRWPVAAVRYAGMLAGWLLCLLPPLLLALPAQAVPPQDQAYCLPVALGALVLAGLGFVLLLADGRRRGPHDLLAGTEVVYEQEEA